MDIVLALIYGAAVGTAAHFAVRGRDLRGIAVGPLLGTLVGGLVWLALTWVGLTTNDVWLWLATLAVPLVVTFPALAVLTRIRRSHDERERVRLRLG